MMNRLMAGIHNRSCPVMPQSDPGKPAYTTPSHGRQLIDAEACVNAVIRVNSGPIAALHQTNS